MAVEGRCNLVATSSIDGEMLVWKQQSNLSHAPWEEVDFKPQANVVSEHSSSRSFLEDEEHSSVDSEMSHENPPTQLEPMLAPITGLKFSPSGSLIIFHPERIIALDPTSGVTLWMSEINYIYGTESVQVTADSLNGILSLDPSGAYVLSYEPHQKIPAVSRSIKPYLGTKPSLFRPPTGMDSLLAVILASGEKHVIVLDVYSGKTLLTLQSQGLGIPISSSTGFDEEKKILTIAVCLESQTGTRSIEIWEHRLSVTSDSHFSKANITAILITSFSLIPFLLLIPRLKELIQLTRNVLCDCML